MSTQLNPKAKKFGKLILIALVLGSGYLGLKHFGVLDKVFKKSVTVAAIDLPTAPKNAVTAGLKFVPLPSDEPTTKQLPHLKGEVMSWNSQLGLLLSNGGAVTTSGSLMEQNGVNLTLVRQDNGVTSMTNLIKFAKDYKNNPTTATGTNFYIMMGDGFPQAVAAMNKELKTLGEDYRAEIIFGVGKSMGEDVMMANPSWRQNPQNAKGSLVSCVILDGDHNLALLYCAANNIKINTDEHTYDPDAMNFSNADDYVKAGEKYISGAKETRKLIKDGKIVGDTTVAISAVCTWSPVDYSIATKSKGGLVRIISTKDFSSQMIGAVVMIKKYADDHRELVENFIRAALEGGDQVNSFSPALDKACEISAKFYNEKDTKFWKDLDLGTSVSDKQGLQVEIGGSSQFNLQSNLNYFGLTPGTANIYASVYKTFADLDLTLYPERFKDTPFPKLEDAIDLSFLQNVANSKSTVATSGESQTYSNDNKILQVVAKRSYNIEFTSGSAILTQNGITVVDKIYDQLSIANSLKVELDGFTDSNGSEAINQPLSLARATAVKTYLQTKSNNSFPEIRFIVNGFGSANPVADNSTKTGQAKNRRVTVVLGN